MNQLLVPQVQDTLASATQLAEERLSNFRTVAAFAKQDKEVDDYKDKMVEVLSVANKEAVINAKFFGMVRKETEDRLTNLIRQKISTST